MSRSHWTRLSVVAAFIVVWAAIGWIGHLEPNTYLVVGVPLTFLFQVAIVRRPLGDLWYRGQRRPVRPSAWLVAVALAATPVYSLLHLGRHTPWSIYAWMVCAIGGAFVAAIPLSQPLGPQLRGTAKCLAAAGLCALAGLALTLLLRHRSPPPPWSMTMRFAHDLALYVPVVFMIEEVTFRGCLGQYLNPPTEPFSWTLAVVLSCFWGWWHLPIVHLHSVVQFVLMAALVPIPHVITGIWFSRYQWESRSLVPGAFTHAFIDAMRNALGFFPG